MKFCFLALLPLVQAGVSPPNGGLPRDDYVPVGEIEHAGLQFLAQTAMQPSLALPPHQFGGATFDQKVDHLDAANTQTFKQLYIENDSQYREGGPVFLSIGGESALGGGIHGMQSWLAGQYGAKMVALEHRYYGSSHPFDSMTTEELRFLSAEQAVEDLMYFREFINKKMGRSDAKWVVFGGSYSASLAAWIREAHPDAIHAAIASSAPVVALIDFVDFDKQVGIGLNKIGCGEVVQELNRYLTEELVSNGPALKQRFGASKLSDGDFSYLMADAIAWAVQYGAKERVCDPISAKKGDKQGMLDAFAQHSKRNFYPTLETGNAMTYETNYLSESNVHGGKNARQWLYQQCTELGWFQTSPAENSYRMQFVNITYFKSLCQGAFGKELWPDQGGLQKINNKYHGKDVKSSHIAFTFGEDDPWQPVGKLESDDNSQMSMVIHCHGCSHCVDMSRSGQGAVSAAQDKVNSFLKRWLEEKP